MTLSISSAGVHSGFLSAILPFENTRNKGCDGVVGSEINGGGGEGKEILRPAKVQLPSLYKAYD